MDNIPFTIDDTAVTGDIAVIKGGIADFFQGAWDFLVFVGVNYGLYIALGLMALSVVSGLLYRFTRVRM